MTDETPLPIVDATTAPLVPAETPEVAFVQTEADVGGDPAVPAQEVTV